MYHHNDWNELMPMMWFWGIFLLIICVLGIAIIWKLSGHKNRHKGVESPMDILKRRYANGEMTSEEYGERKKILEEN